MTQYLLKFLLMAIKEKSRKIGLNPNPNLILCHGGISYCFCSVFKWEWQIKWSPPPPTPHHVLFLSAASSFIPPVTGSGEGRLD